MLGSALGYKQPVSPRTLGRYRRQQPLGVTRDGTANQYSKREVTRWCKQFAKSPSWSYIADHAQPISVDNIRLTTLPATAAATPDPEPDPDPVEPWESVLRRAGHSDGPRREHEDDRVWMSSSSLMRRQRPPAYPAAPPGRSTRGPARCASHRRWPPRRDPRRCERPRWTRLGDRLARQEGRF